MAFRTVASGLVELGLQGGLMDYDEDAIQKAWKLAFAKAHPDKGGSNEACIRITEARDFILRVLVTATPPRSEPYCPDCEECLWKHPASCSCSCKTCRKDAPKQRFWSVLELCPEYEQVFRGYMDFYTSKAEKADRSARVSEEATERLREAYEFSERARRKAEKSLADVMKAHEEEAKNREEAVSSTDVSFSSQYYSKIRSELHLGKTTGGAKLTPAMVRERFQKLEERHTSLAPRYQGDDADVLAILRDKFKEVFEEAAREINKHITEEVASVHTRLDNIEIRLSGSIPPRREGQTATQRKNEIDEVLPALRRERQACVEEEKAAKAARRSGP